MRAVIQKAEDFNNGYPVTLIKLTPSGDQEKRLFNGIRRSAKREFRVAFDSDGDTMRLIIPEEAVALAGKQS